VRNNVDRSLINFGCHFRTAKPEETPPDPRIQPPSTLLLKTEAPRGGKKSKTFAKTNMHILVEFGLKVLHLLFKQGRLSLKQQSHMEMLDPFVDMLTNILTCKHPLVGFDQTRLVSNCLVSVFR
jgi:U3 small nucleolar RNA-associated protein 20